MVRTHGRRTERGVTAVLVALVLTALVGMLALTINAGHLIATRGENQNAVDSAALAGAYQLNGRPSGLTAARPAAENAALEHVTDSSAAERIAGSVQFGRWNLATRYFTPINGNDAVAAQQINAVRVVSSASQEVWGGSLLGSGNTKPVGAEAIAVAGPLSRIWDCDLPYVLRQGCVDGKCDETSGPAFYYVSLSSATADTAGITVMQQISSVSTRLMCDLLQDDNYCKNIGPQVGDWIETANGTNGTSANCGSDGDGDPSDDGKICEIVANKVGLPDDKLPRIPVVKYEGESAAQCSGNYVEAAEIIRFETVRVVFVQCAKNQPLQARIDPHLTSEQVLAMRSTCYPATNPKGGTTNPQTCIVLQLACGMRDNNGPPGGSWGGGTIARPRLVY